MRRAVLLSFLVLLCSTARAQSPAPADPADRPGGELKIVKTISSSSPLSPSVVDPNAAYSNVTTYSGQGRRQNPSSIETGTSNRITRLVMDDLTFNTTAYFRNVTTIQFSVVNFLSTSVTARARLRFWNADGAPLGPGLPNGPGTVLTDAGTTVAYTFSPYPFPPGVTVLSGTPTQGFNLPIGTPVRIWAGVTFDNNGGTSGATQIQMDNIGQGLFAPVDVGTSADTIFQTTAAGSFLNVASPAGSPVNFGGAPIADTGWELVITPTTPPSTTINPGIDVFTTPPGGTSYEDFCELPIPAGFFGPGSRPFDGRVVLVGVPLLPAQLGPTDTVVQRTQGATVIFPGGVATMPIEIVALSLQSVTPITVTYSGGPSEQWTVQVCLSNAVPQPAGTMTITNGQCAGEGGTFTSDLPVCPKLTFTRSGSPAVRTLDPCASAMPPLLLKTTRGHWVDAPDPALQLTQVAPGVLLDNDCDPVTPAISLAGTSNFHPGVGVRRSAPGCNVATPQRKRLTEEQAQLAAHGVLPAQNVPPDQDLDGIGDDADNCKFVANGFQVDTDDDGVGDDCDNCRKTYNPGQEDADADVVGDVCDCNLADAGIGNCDDDNACTTDSCNAVSGCSTTFNTNACDDANPCTTNDTCAVGGCTGAPLSCNDNNSCTNDSCVERCPGVATCAHAAVPTGTACLDQTSGQCDNPDTCDASGSCALNHLPNGTACNDANACTSGESCNAGTCGGGATITAPPETQGLLASSNKQTYSWAQAPFATQYDVVRGRFSALPVGPGGGGSPDEACFDNLPAASVNDPLAPGSGIGFWYLSRGENACGNGTFGSQGVQGAPGALRVTTTCP